MKQKLSSYAIADAVGNTIFFAFCHAALWALVPIIRAGTAGSPPSLFSIIVPAAFVFSVHCVLHALVGRGVVAALQGLTAKMDQVYPLDGRKPYHQWPPRKSLAYGSMWPIRMWLIPYYLIALGMGFMYRDLFDAWDEPEREEEESVSVPMRKRA